MHISTTDLIDLARAVETALPLASLAARGPTVINDAERDLIDLARAVESTLPLAFSDAERERLRDLRVIAMQAMHRLACDEQAAIEHRIVAESLAASLFRLRNITG